MRMMDCLVLGSAAVFGMLTAANADSVSGDPVARAMASMQQAIPQAEADPARPLYHFHAQANWMNDPNGPIYHQGYYHLFYQLNPYGDTWGHMHWGHARSRDLVHWQHLPIALWPSEERGEQHVFSGCTVLGPKGQPLAFYTSIGQGKPAETYAEQWMATGDKDLLTWRKHPGNPVLAESLHGGVKVFDWRDPFFFQEKGSNYLVLGGNLNQRQGGKAVVNLYRAESNDLTRWRYLGVLFTHPDTNVVNIECPNFFRLGERWVLVVSPHGPVEYFVGDLDLTTFQFKPQHRGVFDLGGNYYAPNSLTDHRGRRIMWGWVNGFKPGQGWNGCLSLPRSLTIGPHDELLQKPAQELKKLRSEHFRLSDVSLDESPHVINGCKGDCIEVYADVEMWKANVVQLKLRRSEDGTRFIPITLGGNELDVAGAKAPFRLQAGEKTVKLNLFLDRSVLEVFANDRLCFARVIQAQPQDLGLEITASGGTARLRSFHAWKMRPIW
jgi:beta-fructofuranosidase